MPGEHIIPLRNGAHAINGPNYNRMVRIVQRLDHIYAPDITQGGPTVAISRGHQRRPVRAVGEAIELGALGQIYALSGPPDPLEMQCTLTELDENDNPVPTGLPFPVWLFAFDVDGLGWADIDPPVQVGTQVPLLRLFPLEDWCCVLRFVGTCPQGP